MVKIFYFEGVMFVDLNMVMIDFIIGVVVVKGEVFIKKGIYVVLVEVIYLGGFKVYIFVIVNVKDDVIIIYIVIGGKLEKLFG